MHVGKWLYVKYEGKIREGTVIKIYSEDLDIRLEDNTIITRKYWEVRSIPNDKKD